MAGSRTDSFTLAEGVADALTTTVPDAFGATVNDVLLAALAWRYVAGSVTAASPTMPRVSVLLEGHGRYEDVLATGDDAVRADLSRAVGWFTTIAPVSLDPPTASCTR